MSMSDLNNTNIPLEIYLDIITTKHPNNYPPIKISDDSFYIIKDENLTTESSYEFIYNIIESKIQTLQKTNKIFYNIVPLSCATLFGRGLQRLSKRGCDVTYPITHESMKDYIQSYTYLQKKKFSRNNMKIYSIESTLEVENTYIYCIDIAVLVLATSNTFQSYGCNEYTDSDEEN